MELAQWLKENNVKMTDFGRKIGRAQSIVSRLAARKHRPDPSSALKIVMATRGAVTLDDLYGLNPKYRCKCHQKN